MTEKCGGQTLFKRLGQGSFTSLGEEMGFLGRVMVKLGPRLACLLYSQHDPKLPHKISETLVGRQRTLWRSGKFPRAALVRRRFQHVVNKRM